MFGEFPINILFFLIPLTNAENFKRCTSGYKLIILWIQLWKPSPGYVKLRFAGKFVFFRFQFILKYFCKC